MFCSVCSETRVHSSVVSVPGACYLTAEAASMIVCVDALRRWCVLFLVMAVYLFRLCSRAEPCFVLGEWSVLDCLDYHFLCLPMFARLHQHV